MHACANFVHCKGYWCASILTVGILPAIRSNVSLVVLVMEGTRGIDFMFGIILSVVVANWVAHHIHHDGVYESELERIGNLYFLRDEPPHRYGLSHQIPRCGNKRSAAAGNRQTVTQTLSQCASLPGANCQLPTMPQWSSCRRVGLVWA